MGTNVARGFAPKSRSTRAKGTTRAISTGLNPQITRGAEKAKPGVNWSESDNKAARPVKTWRSGETGKV